MKKTAPIPNYFTPAVVPDVIELKFVEASVQMPLELADTWFRSKIKIYHSSTQTYTAKTTDSYSQAYVCNAIESVELNLKKMALKGFEDLDTIKYQSGFGNEFKSEDSRCPNSLPAVQKYSSEMFLWLIC
ncbi:HGD [Lepeophtheirus salmonis]|uniref:HGD n=1 Tax=Lepeophtheirus salmonis TaxID=72036 RepID=A0A7R8CN96_LEPSM|nr:HGD [Lepeophtheirus salmonis]CAF2873604.1 HGD [Lepeophtheirus salmonis]